jgi:hypothetical protein
LAESNRSPRNGACAPGSRRRWPPRPSPQVPSAAAARPVHRAIGASDCLSGACLYLSCSQQLMPWPRSHSHSEGPPYQDYTASSYGIPAGPTTCVWDTTAMLILASCREHRTPTTFVRAVDRARPCSRGGRVRRTRLSGRAGGRLGEASLPLKKRSTWGTQGHF